MPSEWLGVHGGRSYGPSPRGKYTPGPAVLIFQVIFRFYQVDFVQLLVYNLIYS